MDWKIRNFEWRIYLPELQKDHSLGQDWLQLSKNHTVLRVFSYREN